MSNRHTPADAKPGHKGLTKLEAAAIRIAAGMYANLGMVESTSKAISKAATFAANDLFDELDRLEAGRLDKMDGEV